MRRWQMTQQGLKSLFLVVLILAGCAASGGSDNPEQGCGGSEATVSCLTILSIVPTGGSNVDAFAHACTIDPATGAVQACANASTFAHACTIDTATGATQTAETLTDSTASVTFDNPKFSTAMGTFDIT